MRGGRERAYRRLWDYLVLHAPRPRGDAVVCFGCRDLGVPRRAARLYHDGAAPVVAVTGSGVEGREALVFAEALLDHGVPRHAIVVEDEATHTGENVAFAMRRLAEEGCHPDRVVAVSWPLAARRCRATFAHQFPEVVVDTAPSGPPPGRRWPARDRAVRAAIGEYDRLQRYAELGLLRRQPTTWGVAAAAERLRSAAGEAEALLVDRPLQPVLEGR